MNYDIMFTALLKYGSVSYPHAYGILIKKTDS